VASNTFKGWFTIWAGHIEVSDKTTESKDTCRQEHSHCRSGIGQGTDKTRTHFNRSINTVGQVSVRARTRKRCSVYVMSDGSNMEVFILVALCGEIEIKKKIRIFMSDI
jgi:hypothetical protein